MRDSLQTDAVTLAELFSNGKRYRVPTFQRSYSWTETEWDDLWRDIVSEEGSPAAHYMGAIVLRQNEEDGDLYEVIDGQQRLATLTIVIASLLRELESWGTDGPEGEKNQERLSLLRERFLAHKDAASLNRESRLTLSRSDDDFFQSAIVNGHAPTAPSRLRNGSKALWRAQEYFAALAHRTFSGAKDGAALAKFVEERIARRLTFIRIVVGDEAAAYTVFETLNARGVALGTADLLKNLVLARASSGGEPDLIEMTRRWDRLITLVPLESLAGLVRHHANTRAKDVGQRQIFKHVRDQLVTKEDAFEYIDALTRSAHWYAGLLDTEDDLWNDYPEARPWIRVLSVLRAEQFRPLALAACPAFEGDGRRMKQLFKLIATLSFRATAVMKLNSGDIYRTWNRAAVAFESDEISTVVEIAARVRELAGDDEEFTQAFGALSIPAAGPRKKLLRYILAELESDAGDRRIDWEADDWTIEHILPRSEAVEWPISDADREANASRIGNYVPLEPRLNRQADQLPFGTKKEIYAQSSYALPRSVSAHEWGPEAIRRRSRDYAERARHIWRVDFE